MGVEGGVGWGVSLRGAIWGDTGSKPKCLGSEQLCSSELGFRATWRPSTGRGVGREPGERASACVKWLEGRISIFRSRLLEVSRVSVSPVHSAKGPNLGRVGPGRPGRNRKPALAYVCVPPGFCAHAYLCACLCVCVHAYTRLCLCCACVCV